MGRSAHTDEITRRMFVATADGNYMLARIAHAQALDTDFWWLGMHAVEKYLKAILLLNGRSSKGAGHDLVKLHDAVSRLDPRVAFGPFADPHIADLHWRQCTIEDFLHRLNEYGSAANRYLTYGHTASPDDLVKVDQLVWSVRRHCTLFSVEVGDGSERRTIDWLQRLVDRSDAWHLGGTLPLEKVIARDPADGLRTSLMHLNVAFDPGAPHTLESLRFSASNPPFADWVMRLRSEGASRDTRDTSAEVLRWALDNIQFVKADRQLIEGELRHAGYAIPAGPPQPGATAPAAPVPAAPAAPEARRSQLAMRLGALLTRAGRRLSGD